MISTSRMLIRELSKLEDDFIIVHDKKEDREYIVESIQVNGYPTPKINLNIRENKGINTLR